MSFYRPGGSGQGSITTEPVQVNEGGTGSTTAAGARTNLGLGSIATQSAASVAITGGTIGGITDLAVTDGGTGASSASGARTNLLPSYTGNANKVLSLNGTATDVEWTTNGAGTVTSVDMTVPTGLTVSGNPVTSSGTLAVSLASGYSIPTTTKQSNWDTAYGWGDHAAAGYLDSGDIGTTVQGYDADTAKYDDATANFTGTLQKSGSNVLTASNIGSTVQAYDADTAKYDDTTANFTGTLQQGGSNVLKATDIGTSVQAYDADTAKYDDVTANFTGTLQKSGSNVLTASNIGSTVQAYDADTAKYDDTTANFTGTLQQGGSNVVKASDIGSSVQAYDSNLTSFVGTFTLPTTDGTNGQFLSTNGSGTLSFSSAGAGSVTSVDMSVPTGLAISGNPITSSGTLAVTYASGYSIPTTASQSNWDTAYTDRLKWDGGSTGLTASTGRTSLGATTLGSNIFTITNPSAVTFPRFNADNTVSSLSAADFRTAIGAGTGNGTVTSVTGTSPVASSGGATPAISLASGYGDTQNPYASKTANFFLAAPSGTAGTPSFRAIVAADIPTLNQNTTGTASNVTGTVAVANGGTGATTAANARTNLAVPGTGTTNTFTAAQTFRAASAIRSEAASTQDAVVIAGRAGGISSYAVTITPTTLGANRTLTLPDASTTVVGTDTTQTLTNKTLTDPTLIGTPIEDIFTITDGAAFEIDPANGSIQLITLGASRTPKATNFANGEAITLMVNDGTAYTLTWTDATFGGSGVVWKTNAGVAPTLNTSGYTVIVLWKVGGQVYGARVGDA